MKKQKELHVSQTMIETVFHRLTDYYKTPKTELIYQGPFQLLISVILSAQCTDAQVNRSTPALFSAYPDPKRMGMAPIEELERLVKSCGFYRMKAKAIKKTSQDLVEKFSGEVPGDLDALTTLAGVGRKTASVVLNQAFDIPAIAVDTHVRRVSNRLGWARQSDPVKIEFELRDLIPQPWWTAVNGFLIMHGRRICQARKPKCETCFLNDLCPSGQAFIRMEERTPSKRKARP